MRVKTITLWRGFCCSVSAMVRPTPPLPPAIATTTILSLGWVSYAFNSVATALGDGRFLPEPDISGHVVTLVSGDRRENKSWVIGRLIRRTGHVSIIVFIPERSKAHWMMLISATRTYHAASFWRRARGLARTYRDLRIFEYLGYKEKDLYDNSDFGLWMIVPRRMIKTFPERKESTYRTLRQRA